MNSKLPIKEFGRQLISTGDLDPIYIALNATGWDRATRCRWLTAYCAFYHAGVACFMSERTGNLFWSAMTIAAANVVQAPIGERWPRSKERRHFRGQQAIDGVSDWAIKHQQPEDMFKHIAGPSLPEGQTFDEVRNRALEYRSVGSWLSFKMVDLCDACLGVEVQQDDITPFLYETPRQGAKEVWEKELSGIVKREATEDQAVRCVVQYLQKGFNDLTIPHKPGLSIDMFVVETVLCKWHSHMNGHYPIGNDIREIREGLKPWLKVTDAAGEFIRVMPKEVE